jgi:hypothetical protein
MADVQEKILKKYGIDISQENILKLRLIKRTFHHRIWKLKYRIHIKDGMPV